VTEKFCSCGQRNEFVLKVYWMFKREEIPWNGTFFKHDVFSNSAIFCNWAFHQLEGVQKHQS